MQLSLNTVTLLNSILSLSVLLLVFMCLCFPGDSFSALSVLDVLLLGHCFIMYYRISQFTLLSMNINKMLVVSERVDPKIDNEEGIQE